MAKRKAKVMVATLSLFISLATLVLGVYSIAASREATISSTISFTATEVRVGYKLESSEAYGGSASPSYSTVEEDIAEYGNTTINLTIPEVSLNTGNNKFSYRFTLTSLDQVKTIYGSLDYTNITHAAFKRTITATVDNVPFTGVWFDLPATKAVVITYVFEIDSSLANLTENFNVGSTYQLNLDEHEIPTTFSGASPAAIAYAANYNRIPSSWVVGNTKPITLTESGTFSIRISDLQTGRYTKVNGGATNIVIEFVEIVETGVPWDTRDPRTNEYATSSLRAYLNDGFFKKLPAEWQKVIPEVQVPTVTGGNGTDKSDIKFLPEKVFNLSDIEVGLKSGTVEEIIFDYYYGKENSFKIKQFNSSNYNWWLRVPHHLSTIYARGFSQIGGYYQQGTTSTASISPCFAL